MTEYRGRVWIDHWHDGDTFYGIIDPGWGINLGGDRTKLERVRISGINAPELTLSNAVDLVQPVSGVVTKRIPATPNPAGLKALAYAKTLAPEKAFYDYVGHNRDKYGRPLMDIEVPIPRKGKIVGYDLFSKDMLDAGHAVVMR